MKKSNIKNYLHINKEELANYYSNHTPKECIEKFNLPSIYIFIKLLNIFEIPIRPKSDIIKDMHKNMSEETKAIRHKKESEARKNFIFTPEIREKQRLGNLGKSKGGGTGKRVSPLKGQSKENNTALKRMSEERTGKKHWTEESWNKRTETLRKNGTFNTSTQEKIMYKVLCNEYGEDNILTNYDQDPRYPFHCDFYIPSEDLFIELNCHWSHNIKPYDPNDKECQELLQIWLDKANNSNNDHTRNSYLDSINTWTIRDVNKQNIAKQNNLNYKVIYDDEYKKYYKNKLN